MQNRQLKVTSWGAAPVIEQAAVPQGLDAIFEGVGPAHILPSAALLAPGGILVCFGFVSSAKGVQKPSPGVVLRSLWMVGQTFARLAWIGRCHCQTFYDIKASAEQEPAHFRADLESLMALLAAGQIRPEVKAVGFAEAPEAHALLAQGGIRGRLSLIHS